MKKHSSKRCCKGKTGYRTPSTFRNIAGRRNKKSNVFKKV